MMGIACRPLTSNSIKRSQAPDLGTLGPSQSFAGYGRKSTATPRRLCWLQPTMRNDAPSDCMYDCTVKRSFRMTSGAPATFSATSQIAEVEQVDQLSGLHMCMRPWPWLFLIFLACWSRRGRGWPTRARLLFEYRQWPNTLGVKVPTLLRNWNRACSRR